MATRERQQKSPGENHKEGEEKDGEERDQEKTISSRTSPLRTVPLMVFPDGPRGERYKRRSIRKDKTLKEGKSGGGLRARKMETKYEREKKARIRCLILCSAASWLSFHLSFVSYLSRAVFLRCLVFFSPCPQGKVKRKGHGQKNTIKDISRPGSAGALRRGWFIIPAPADQWPLLLFRKICLEAVTSHWSAGANRRINHKPLRAPRPADRLVSFIVIPSSSSSST